MSTTIFTNAMMIDARSDAPREGALVVEDGRIKEILDSSDGPTGARVIDAGGRTLMPGLIDAHVHVKATSLDFRKLEITPVSYLIGQTAGIMKAMLMRGFTTVRDAAGADRGLSDAVDDGLFVGPRMRVCGLALSQTGGHSDLRYATQMSQAYANEAHNLRQHFESADDPPNFDQISEVGRLARAPSRRHPQATLYAGRRLANRVQPNQRSSRAERRRYNSSRA